MTLRYALSHKNETQSNTSHNRTDTGMHTCIFVRRHMFIQIYTHTNWRWKQISSVKVTRAGVSDQLSGFLHLRLLPPLSFRCSRGSWSAGSRGRSSRVRDFVRQTSKPTLDLCSSVTTRLAVLSSGHSFCTHKTWILAVHFSPCRPHLSTANSIYSVWKT